MNLLKIEGEYIPFDAIDAIIPISESHPEEGCMIQMRSGRVRYYGNTEAALVALALVPPPVHPSIVRIP